jgi:hypothetical protein
VAAAQDHAALRKGGTAQQFDLLTGYLERQAAADGQPESGWTEAGLRSPAAWTGTGQRVPGGKRRPVPLAMH